MIFAAVLCIYCRVVQDYWHVSYKALVNSLAMDCQRIPFNVRFTDAAFRGEITGLMLNEGSEFKVKLSGGQTFNINARFDKDARCSWVSMVKHNFNKLVPVIGKVIERHFLKIHKG